MPTIQLMRPCKKCGRQTMHLQQKPNHLLHLVLTALTFGLWLVVWIFQGGKPQCTVCGHSPGPFGLG